MSLASQTLDGFTRVGQEVKSLRSQLPAPTTRILSYGAGGLGSLCDFSQSATDKGFRRIVSLPCKTTRYRHKMRNFNTTNGVNATGYESSGAGSLTGSGIVQGLAEIDSLGMPTGNFQGGVGNTQTTSGYTIPNTGGWYVGPWITDSSQQFSVDVPMVFATGWTSGSAVAVNVMTERVWKYASSSAALNPATTGGTFGNNGSPGIGASAGNGVSGMPLDWLIEYETSDSAPAVLWIGDSLAEGVTGPGNAAKTTAAGQLLADAYYAYPLRYAMREQVHVTNMSLMNSTTAQWGHSTLIDRWSRVDIPAGKYNAIVIALGSNDASVSTTLANYKTQMASVVSRARSYVGAGSWVPLYFVTVTPRNFTSNSAQENARLAYNDWIAQLPFNAEGVIDLDTALGMPSSATPPATSIAMRTQMHMDGAHYSYMGTDVAAATAAASLPFTGRR